MKPPSQSAEEMRFVALRENVALRSGAAILVNVFPARRTREIMAVAGLLLVVALFVLIRILKPERFVDAARENNADIVGVSALLTTTMTYMKTVIDGFDKPGYDHIKMAIGGAPISQMFADEIGADGYGDNAPSAVHLARQSVATAT
mgnify:CR=1 FL=1